MSGIMDDVREASGVVSEATPAAETAVEVTPAPKSEATAEKASRERDDSGRFAKKETPEAPATTDQRPDKAASTTKGAEAPETKAEPETPAATAATAYKPPQSWRPEVREKWAALPPDVQAEVARVDGEVRKVMQSAAQSRRVAEELDKTFAPYRAIMTGEPMQVMGSLLQTAAQLQTGTPATRATLVAHIIKGYGVDVNILADILDKGPQGALPEQPQSGQYRDPRVDQMLEQQRQQQEAQIRRAISDFSAKAEFFNDVSPRMAALIDEADARGETLSLEDAYDAACWADQSIRKVLAQREVESKAKANAAPASTQQAKAAASSVKSNPTAGVASPTKGSILDEVRAAAAQHGGR